MTALQELVTGCVSFEDEQEADVAWPTLRKFENRGCHFNRNFKIAPDIFPELEVLALVCSSDDAWDAVLATPSLRALILSIDSPASLDDCALGDAHILWNVGFCQSAFSLLLRWGRKQRPVHIRCRPGEQCTQLSYLVARDEPILWNLKTVYVVNQTDILEEGLWNAFDRLKEVGDRRGVRVVREPKVEGEDFRFDYFFKEHGKPLSPQA